MNPRMNEKERDALVALGTLRDIGGVRYKKLESYFGSALAILRAPLESLERIYGLGEKLAAAISRLNVEHGTRERIRCEKAGIWLITAKDENYPVSLVDINSPPLVLYGRGDIEALGKNLDRSVAIVGTRRATDWGLAAAKELAYDLARRGCTVVSGLALGVDGQAHRGALEAKGTTVAVMAHGLLMIHPPSHRNLAQRIIESGGAVVSDYSLDTRPTPFTFPARNRLISGLSRAVAVVEAPGGSGALHTARHAEDQSRDCFAFPGRLNDAVSRGCIELIRRNQAHLLVDASDIVECMERRIREREASKMPEALLDSEEKVVMTLLDTGSMTLEDLLMASGLKVEKLLPCLLKLEMRSLVLGLPGQIYARKALVQSKIHAKT